MKKGKVTKVMWPKNLSVDGWEKMRGEVERPLDGSVRIGASDVSVATGSNKWKCPQRLFHHLTGFYSSFFITESTLAGHLAEEIVMKRWSGFVPGDEQQSLLNVRNGVVLQKTKKANFFLLNSNYPQLFASLDYVPVGKQYSPFTGELYAPLTPNEIKNTNGNYYKLWQGGITQQYKEQLHSQMMISNTEVAIFHVYIDGSKYVVMEVEREKELCEFIDYNTRKFTDIAQVGRVCVEEMSLAVQNNDTQAWEDWKAQYDSITPDPIGMDDNVDLAEELFPDSNTLIKQGDYEDYDNMTTYLQCNEQIKELDSKKSLLRSKLLLSCGEFEGIQVEDRKLINRRASDGKKAYFAIK